MRNLCPVCGKQLVMPIGNPSSPILLVGSYPGWEEIRDGIPFVGKTGEVLSYELGKVGIDFNTCRRTNLWLHDQDRKKCDVAWHRDELAKEFAGRKFVLLMGSDTVATLLDRKVSELYGLQVKIPSYNGTHFWVSPNPAIAFHSPIGDLKLSFERFAADVQISKKRIEDVRKHDKIKA